MGCKEKGIKAEDVKNLPPTEEIHGLCRGINTSDVLGVRT